MKKVVGGWWKNTTPGFSETWDLKWKQVEKLEDIEMLGKTLLFSLAVVHQHRPCSPQLPVTPSQIYQQRLAGFQERMFYKTPLTIRPFPLCLWHKFLSLNNILLFPEHWVSLRSTLSSLMRRWYWAGAVRTFCAFARGFCDISTSPP